MKDIIIAAGIIVGMLCLLMCLMAVATVIYTTIQVCWRSYHRGPVLDVSDMTRLMNVYGKTTCSARYIMHPQFHAVIHHESVDLNIIREVLFGSVPENTSVMYRPDRCNDTIIVLYGNTTIITLIISNKRRIYLEEHGYVMRTPYITRESCYV